MDNLNGTGRLVGALVVGALAGAALGILFAPEKGSKTRSNILDGAKDLASDVKKKMTDEAAALRKKADDLENAVKDKVEEVYENVKHKAEDVVKNNR
jgi:gas vesicle protein